MIPPPAAADPTEVAGRLRVAAFRLARLLRQQDDSGVSPALLTALAVIDRDGEITLGELARQEQVTPPTITKVVATLEEKGWVERRGDEADARVSRLRTTAKGRKQLDASRARRTAWLARQLGELTAADLARVHASLDALEQLTTVRAPEPRVGVAP